MVNAQQLKCKLIDYLLKHQHPQMIGVEVPFISSKRWVDLLLLTKRNNLVAFEIKSDFDSLKRLKGQITDYRRTFNQVYVVLTEHFANHSVISLLPPTVGIMIFEGKNQRFKVIRKATSTYAVKKSNLTRFLWKEDLRKIINCKWQSVDDARQWLSKNRTKRYIAAYAINAIKSRYLSRYKLFLKEKTRNETHIADLDYLTKHYATLF